MITIKETVNCCGCNACGDVCPKGAISFTCDNEGFWYPKVNVEICIDCGLCEKTCPIISKAESIERYQEPRVFAAYNKDNFVRLDSTSGGIHSAIATYVFLHQGYVGGAIYNENHTVSHITTNNPLKLTEIRSSKYLQSQMLGQYRIVKELLTQGKTVFYCGTPCQIQALYKFLRTDYENLITADFICRGVNSPKVFISYINMLEQQYGAKASKIKFKSKRFGWHNFATQIIFTNGKEYCKDRDHDLFLIGYLQSSLFARPSCYDCRFKGFPQKADITLADFWGIEKIDSSMDQDKGTSLVMVNSDKGMKLFNVIKNSMVWKEFSMSEAKTGNMAIDSSIEPISNKRKEFFVALERKPFDQVAKEFFPIRTQWQWYVYRVKVAIARLITFFRR